jgi:hypothetical protein
MSISRRTVRSRSAAWNGPGWTVEMNSAVSVCCGVRAEPSFAPNAFTSAKSAAYCAEVVAGGGAGRNWLGDSIISGVVSLRYLAKNGALAGAVGRQRPGAAAVSKLFGPYRPSSARSAMKRSAVCLPYWIPCVVDGS